MIGTCIASNYLVLDVDPLNCKVENSRIVTVINLRIVTMYLQYLFLIFKLIIDIIHFTL